MVTIYRLSLVTLVGPALALALALIAVFWLSLTNYSVVYEGLLAVAGANIFDRYAGLFETFGFYARMGVLLGLLVLLGMFLVPVVRYATTELRVFHDRVVWRTGFIRRDVFTASLKEVVGVQFQQSVIGRMLGYGTIMINTRGDDQIIAHLISGAPEASAEIIALKA